MVAEFRLVSDKSGPLTTGDIYRLPELFLIHGIYSDAVITKIELKPHWDRTQMIVTLENFGGTESDLQQQLPTPEPVDGESAENTPDSPGTGANRGGN